MIPAPVSALSEAHRVQQSAIAADVGRQVIEAWRVVDPTNIDAAWPLVSRALTHVIARGYAASTVAAVHYLHGHAALSGVALQDVTTSPTLNTEQLSVSLRVTGPVAVKQAAAAGASPVTAAAIAQVRLIGSAGRLVLLGGRSTITRTVDRSDQIIGYRRVGDGHECNFCNTLISRGAVYKTAEHATTVVGRAGRPRGDRQIGSSFHDHCHCQSEALYVGQGEPADVTAAFERYLAQNGGRTARAA